MSQWRKEMVAAKQTRSRVYESNVQKEECKGASLRRSSGVRYLFRSFAEHIMRAVILLGLLASAAFATTQTVSQTSTADGRIHTRIEGIGIPSITAAPFTARVVVTWNQPLIGGGTVSRTYYTVVARDSQGRVRRETRDFVPADSNAEPPLLSFAVTDPVAGSRITCEQGAMNCTVVDFRAALTLDEATVGPSAGQTKGFTRQSLGQQTMDALPVAGTRETTITNSGTGGNSRVLVRSRDLWYSPDLKMYLSVIRNDPQMGQVTLTVTDLVLGEPDPSLFGVPPGYRVVDARSNQTASQ